MFSNAFQSGFISVFYSVGSNPLSLWDKSVKNGHIRRVVDDEVKSLVLEISGTNVATTYITCPIKARASLGIKLPFLVMVLKNMKKYFTFEIQIVDDKDIRRRFRVSNFQSTTKVRPFCTTMPIGLSPGWNQIQFNLADFTKRAYGTIYIETVRVQIHANARIRRIYFSDRLYADHEMPTEFKLFLPVPGTQKKSDTKRGSKEDQKKPKEIEAAVERPPDTKLIEEAPSVAPPGTPIDESARSDKVEEPITEKELIVDEPVVAEHEEASPGELEHEDEEGFPSETEEGGDESPTETGEESPEEASKIEELPGESPTETEAAGTTEDVAEEG